MTQATCSTPGCPKPHRARGLCSTHYNQQHQLVRHRKVTVPCTWCETPCIKGSAQVKRYAGAFCTLACRDAWRKDTQTNPGPSEAARAAARAALSTRRAVALRKLRKAARGTRGWRWVAGNCGRCGRPFVSELGTDLGRYCSDVCKNRAARSRRRARHRGAHHQPYSRAAIFERDGYRCHLCHKRTLRTAVVPHPRAPVIDHLIPLGQGDDAPHNVATACFMCNSKRRDVGDAQLILFG